MLRHRGAIATAPLVLGLLVSGCATNLTGSGLPTTSASADLPAITADKALFAKLPSDVQSSKTISIGSSPTYPPIEFLSDGKVEGLEIDLMNAVAQRLGVTITWKQAEFDQILIGIQAKKYDAGASAFTITKQREQSVNMVSYLSAGSLWTVQKDNPKKVVQGKPCGLTVAVQTGVIQEDEMKQAQKACGSNKINLLSFTDQGEATAALVSGRADVMAADSPVALYAVKKSGGSIQELAKPYDSAPYGIVVPKSDTGMAEAFAQAFRDLKKDGHYDAILAKWGQTEGGVSTFEVNP